MAVVHRQFDVQLARHVLHAQPGRGSGGTVDEPERGGGRVDQPPVFHRAGADHRTGVQPHLGYARQRLRGEVQTLRRAVRDGRTHLVDRQLREHREDRRRRYHRRRQHLVRVRRDEPILCQASHGGWPAVRLERDPQRAAGADLLHAGRSGRGRPAVRDQLHHTTERHDRAVEFFSHRSYRPRDPDAPS